MLTDFERNKTLLLAISISLRWKKFMRFKGVLNFSEDIDWNLKRNILQQLITLVYFWRIYILHLPWKKITRIPSTQHRELMRGLLYLHRNSFRFELLGVASLGTGKISLQNLYELYLFHYIDYQQFVVTLTQLLISSNESIDNSQPQIFFHMWQ